MYHPQDSDRDCLTKLGTLTTIILYLYNSAINNGKTNRYLGADSNSESLLQGIVIDKMFSM